MKRANRLGLATLAVLLAASCNRNDSAQQNLPTPAASASVVKSDYEKGAVTQLCQQAIDKVQASLTSIVATPADARNIDTTLLTFESTMSNFSDEATPLTFMGYVSTNTDVSAEGSACEEKIGQLYVDIYTRRDLYDALKTASPRNDDEKRLVQKTLESFEQNGLKLSDAQLALVKPLMAQISSLEARYSTALNNDTTTVSFTASELTGATEDFLNRLGRETDGRYIVTTKSTDYSEVMENVSNAETRRKMQLAYLSRGGESNTRLLEQAVSVRSQVAKLLGYDTWADYKTVTHMAKSKTNVLTFLNSLKDKLAERNRQDMNQLLVFKKTLDPQATKVDQWDIGYLSYQLQKRDYSLDNEKIREYFPKDVVVSGMFSVYSQMLGVTYREITDAKVWAPDVKLYEIHDKADDRLIGYFYTDFTPRPGKYGHAAAFPLILGRRLASGAYSLPVSAIVANFTPPAGGKPSLLLHDEVETVFHEFGHIMHQTLTRAPYGTLSGSAVAQDFVEAPSQMLENWVWSPQILASLSGLYSDHSQKLPADLLQKLISARDFQQGAIYTKQLLYGLFDMTLHTQSGPVDAKAIYDGLYRDIVGQEPIAGGNFPASFGHLMGGYDAGYYGYLWSEVYAQDMFSAFPPEDLTNAEVGGRYRKVILENGNMQDAIDLLTQFLGRAPNNRAFFKKIHIEE